MRLFALRGAIDVSADEADAILARAEELMRAIMERNSLTADSIVSCIFTATPDLSAEFPAVAARRIGLDRVPLLCAQEINRPGALPRIIRVLVHYHAAEDHQPRHVYLGEANALRADLEAAQ